MLGINSELTATHPTKKRMFRMRNSTVPKVETTLSSSFSIQDLRARSLASILSIPLLIARRRLVLVCEFLFRLGTAEEV